MQARSGVMQLWQLARPERGEERRGGGKANAGRESSMKSDRQTVSQTGRQTHRHTGRMMVDQLHPAMRLQCPVMHACPADFFFQLDRQSVISPSPPCPLGLTVSTSTRLSPRPSRRCHPSLALTHGIDQ